MLYKHTLTLTRLQSFCDSEGIIFLKDITLAHLTKWRAAWTFESPLAKRNNQERVKSFFKFCFDAGLSPTNPPGQLSSIQVKADESTRVSPLCLYACLRGAPRRGLSSRVYAPFARSFACPFPCHFRAVNTELHRTSRVRCHLPRSKCMELR